jgi:uncharacterized RDD family membrane protein YckC
MGYAAIWKRALALVIDSFITTIVGLIFIVISVYMYDYSGGKSDLSLGLMIFFVSLGTSWIYYAACESSSHQATIGKKLLKLKVEDEYGIGLSFSKASIRFLLKQISILFLYLGCIVALFTKKKQSFHDMVCSTYVVNQT